MILRGVLFFVERRRIEKIRRVARRFEISHLTFENDVRRKFEIEHVARFHIPHAAEIFLRYGIAHHGDFLRFFAAHDIYVKNAVLRPAVCFAFGQYVGERKRTIFIRFEQLHDRGVAPDVPLPVLREIFRRIETGVQRFVVHIILIRALFIEIEKSGRHGTRHQLRIRHDARNPGIAVGIHFFAIIEVFTLFFHGDDRFHRRHRGIVNGIDVLCRFRRFHVRKEFFVRGIYGCPALGGVIFCFQRFPILRHVRLFSDFRVIYRVGFHCVDIGYGFFVRRFQHG